ncbi:MAG: TonB-dependent receptor plug domain-containing protein [Gammaproteobacteria bacterium]|nr:TonB-dependent receptor plug domain-containing protein [Gammaproteobacteria bacterium]
MSIRKTLFISLFFAGKVIASDSPDYTVPTIVVKLPLQRLFDTSGQKTMVSPALIRSSGAVTLGQILQSSSSINLIDSTGNGSQAALSLRGFGSNASSNTLLLINGIPISQPDMATPNLNLIPISDIQRIEIIAGSESVLYGDQAVGGLIHINTLNRPPSHSLFSCSTGSYDQKNCYAATYQHYRNLYYKLFANHQFNLNYRKHNRYEQNQIVGALNAITPTYQWRFDLNVNQENLQFPGALTTAEVRANRRQANNDIDFFKDDQVYFQGKYLQNLWQGWRSTVDFARRQMQGHGILSMPFNQSRLTHYIKPEWEGAIKTVQIKTGIELQDDQYHLGSAFGLTENRQQKYSSFGLVNWPLQPLLSLSAGLRGAMQVSQLDTQSDTHFINRAIASTLGMTYKPSAHQQFYLRRAGSYRFPKADENSFTNGDVGSLHPQRGIAYETGSHFQLKQCEIDINFYQLNLRDEIAFDPLQTPQTPFGSNTNLPPTRRTGVSTTLGRNLTDQLHLSAQYHFVNARFDQGIYSGKRIPLVSETILLTNLSYQWHEHWQFYVEARYTGSQYPANDYANIAGRLGGYTLFNANLHYHFKQWDVALRLNNLLGKAYYLYTVYQTNPQQVFFYPAAERNGLLTIQYTLT